MTAERFEAMVRRLEDYSQRHPFAYRVRVALLAGLGYLYIWGVFVVTVALASLTAYWIITAFRLALWKLLLVLLAFAKVIWHAMRVPFDPPDGIEITPTRSPRLFRVIGSLRKFLHTPPIHHVFLTPHFQATVDQMPRLGILGWYRNYLLIGLPLMQALSPEEFRAVLAHELGHLAGQHSRFGSWIYRLGSTWEQILERMQAEKRWGGWIFRVFFNAYMPYLSAYTFALRRQQEYEADRNSAHLTGPKVVASALVRTRVQNKRWGNLWDDIVKRADEHPLATVAAPYSEAASRLLENTNDSEVVLTLKQALAEQTAVDDTHPSFRDRLKALGVLSDSQDEEQCMETLLALNTPLMETAADFLLGNSHKELASMLDRMWHEAVQPEWSERFQQALRGRRRIEELESKAQFAALSEEELWELIQLKAELQKEQQVIPLLHDLLARAPNHAEATYLLGRLLLEQGQTEGLDYLHRVMQANDQIALAASIVAYNYMRDQGQEEQAKQYAEKAMQCIQEIEAAERERSGVTLKDQFEPHGLTAQQVAEIQAQLAVFSDVQKAYLVRKSVKHFPEQPLYVLGVVPYVKWYANYDDKRAQDLLERLTTKVNFPGETYVIVLWGAAKPLYKVLRRVPNAIIFDRAQFRAR